jgi:hypothetical protein
MSVPVPKPVRGANRCILEPFEPKTPRIPLYVAPSPTRLTLQVVYFGLPHFQLPLRPSKSPVTANKREPRQPVPALVWASAAITKENELAAVEINRAVARKRAFIASPIAHTFIGDIENA